MVNNLTLSVLGFTLLSACSTPAPPIEITTVATSRPALILPKSDPITTRNVQWIVITRENVEEKFAELEVAGNSVVIIGLAGADYENLALNLNDLRTFIQQQNSIIIAYEDYYIEQ
jgi:hypothetical protein